LFLVNKAFTCSLNIGYVKLSVNLLFNILIFREEHRKLHEAHKGHESMHAEMLVILMITMIVAQIVLLEWKRRHFKSFQVNYIFNVYVIFPCAN